MITYLTPAEFGDTTPMGLSTGAGTDSLVFATGLAIDNVAVKRRADAVSIADEVTICWENIAIQLEEVGLTLKDVVKTTCFLSSDEYRGEFLEAYKAVLDPGPYPARVTLVVGVALDCRVSIEAIAVHPGAA